MDKEILWKLGGFVVMLVVAVEMILTSRKMRRSMVEVRKSMGHIESSPAAQQARVLVLELRRLEEVDRRAAGVDWDYRVRPITQGFQSTTHGCIVAAGITIVLGILALVGAGAVEKAMGLEAWQSWALFSVALVIILGVALFLGNRSGGWWGRGPLERAIQLYTFRKLKPALARVRKAVAKHPKSLRANYALGCVLLELDRVDEASQALDELARIYPDSVFTHELRARIETLQGREESARNAYRLAAEAAERARATTIAKGFRENAEKLPGDIAAKISPLIYAFITPG
jgi:tetratricopeptide (TPR) repeat protein